MILPFSIPWKFVLIGLLALGVFIGVKTAFATYNQAIADAEFYKGEKDKALQIAERNALALQESRRELERLEGLLKTNREEREKIEVKSNEQIARWRRKAAELAKTDDCIDKPHPPDLLHEQPGENSPPNRDTENVSARVFIGRNTCSALQWLCVERPRNVYIPAAFSH